MKKAVPPRAPGNGAAAVAPGYINAAAENIASVFQKNLQRLQPLQQLWFPEKKSHCFSMPQMLSLAIDLGNTYAKTGLFDQDTLLECRNRLTVSELQQYIAGTLPARLIFASTSRSEAELEQLFGAEGRQVLALTPTLSVPLEKLYDTPQTLGADRLAAAVGARVLLPAHNALVIDMGTCITYDYVDTAGRFHGGLISPGLRMRFRAMHTFTGRLPLLEPPADFPLLVGKSTAHAMQSGVLNGLLAELNGLIAAYREQYSDFQVIMCGGDAPLFETRLKEPIFAAPSLVLVGLNRILQYHAS